MEQLEIETPNAPIAARLFRRAGEELAVMLPGLNYSCDNPLFYYVGQMMHERKVDVLNVDFAYSRDQDFLTDSVTNRLQRLKEDGRAVLEFVNTLGHYKRLTIIGKSVGTVSMAWALPDGPTDLRLIWLTPSLRSSGLTAQMIGRADRAFCLIGRDDPAFSQPVMDELSDAGLTVAVINEADHGFSHKDGAAASAGLVTQAISELSDWLDLTDQAV